MGTWWSPRRRYGDHQAGTLLWVDDAGDMRSLGTYTARELEGLAWSVGVAYRVTRDRGERTRLAGLREAARRLMVGVRGRGKS